MPRDDGGDGDEADGIVCIRGTVGSNWLLMAARTVEAPQRYTNEAMPPERLLCWKARSSPHLARSAGVRRSKLWDLAAHRPLRNTLRTIATAFDAAILLSLQPALTADARASAAATLAPTLPSLSEKPTKF